MNGAYLVSLRAHLAGKPEDGVRDSLSAGSHSGNDAQCMTSASRLHAFWLQLPPEGVNKRKLFNSYDGSDESSHYVSRTLYLSNLPASRSWDWGPACAELVCLRTGCLSAASSARITPGTRAVEVTSFQTRFRWKTRHRERWRSRYQYRPKNKFRLDVEKPLLLEDASLFDNKPSPFGARFTIPASLGSGLE